MNGSIVTFNRVFCRLSPRSTVSRAALTAGWVCAVTLMALVALPLVTLAEDVQMTTTTWTNAETGTFRQRAIYTRDGQTNLVRTRRGSATEARQVLAHRVYQDGKLVTMISEVRGSFSVMTKPGSPYGASVEFYPDKTVRAVALMAADGTFVDLFTGTNGVITPVSSADLRKAQEVGADALELMSGATNKTSSGFPTGLEQMMERHDDE